MAGYNRPNRPVEALALMTDTVAAARGPFSNRWTAWNEEDRMTPGRSKPPLDIAEAKRAMEGAFDCSRDLL